MLEYYKRYPKLLVVDCTYKTNRYNRPLFNVVSATRANETIPLSYCIIAS